MDDSYGYGGAQALFGIIFIAYLGVLGFALLISVAVYVLNGFAFMRLFRKTGVEPWAAWVPVFNYWRVLELGGMPGWISLGSLIPSGSTVTAVFVAIADYRTGLAFRKTGGYVVLAIFLPFVWAFLLSSDTENYEPGLITAAGYPPPKAGFGAPEYVHTAPAPPTAPPTAPSAPNA
jgi:hypothetical protein